MNEKKNKKYRYILIAYAVNAIAIIILYLVLVNNRKLYNVLNIVFCGFMAATIELLHQRGFNLFISILIMISSVGVALLIVKGLIWIKILPH